MITPLTPRRYYSMMIYADTPLLMMIFITPLLRRRDYTPLRRAMSITRRFISRLLMLMIAC